MGGTIHPGVLVVKHVWQWYYDHDHLGKKYKAIYFGPRLDWMKLFKVPGCQSQTWLIPHFVEDDKIYFTADSAALISKGMVCIIADVYSGSRAQDIREFDQKEFEKMNLSALLTPGRNNGVHSMLKKIKFYAKKEDNSKVAV